LATTNLKRACDTFPWTCDTFPWMSRFPGTVTSEKPGTIHILGLTDLCGCGVTGPCYSPPLPEASQGPTPQFRIGRPAISVGEQVIDHVDNRMDRGFRQIIDHIDRRQRPRTSNRLWRLRGTGRITAGQGWWRTSLFRSCYGAAQDISGGSEGVFWTLMRGFQRPASIRTMGCSLFRR